MEKFDGAVWIKRIVFILLILQNATTVLLTRYSRGVLKEKYSASVAVVVVECCKFIISCFFVFIQAENSCLHTQPWTFYKKIWYLIQNSGYAAAPAICYFLQNMLQYTALQNLPTPTYAVLQQFKILSAAVCSYLLLQERITEIQWRALFLLVIGGLLIEKRTYEVRVPANSNIMKGSVAMLFIVSLSGLAGAFTQALLKNKPLPSVFGAPTHSAVATPPHGTVGTPAELSLWDRNLQLAFWSILIGALTVLMEAEWIMENGIFSGWSIYTWLLVLLWTIGGLLVALAIKFTDIIVKGFSSAISLIIISIVGWLLLKDTLDFVFIAGAGITVIATFNYNDKDFAPINSSNVTNHTSSSTSTNIHSYAPIPIQDKHDGNNDEEDEDNEEIALINPQRVQTSS